MQGPDGLERQVALFKQIGNDHLASDLFQKTTNFIDRTLSKVFSKNSHNTAVKNLIQSIRENPNFGDKYANLAKAQLTSALDAGKPLTGRLAAKVLQDIRLTKAEEGVRKTNIDISIDKAFDTHFLAFNDILDEIIENKFHDGAEEAFSTRDREGLLNDIKKSLKISFRDRSPSLEEIKSEINSVVTKKCDSKLLLFCHRLVKEATTDLADQINTKLEELELGLELSLSDDVVTLIKEKIEKSLREEMPELDHMVNSEDVENVRNRVINIVCEAFTTVNESELDQGVREKINTLMAENTSALPTKNMALSFCQGIESGVCNNLSEALDQFDSETTNLFVMAKNFFDDVEGSTIDPDTETRRNNMNRASMTVLLEGFVKLTTGQMEDPIPPAMMEKVRDFIDKATELIKSSDPRTQGPEISRLNQFKEIVVKGFGLTGEMSAKAFMEKNSGIPGNALGMITQVYDEIPVRYQDEALELIKQNCTNGKELLLGTKVEVIEGGGVKLSLDETIALDQEVFLEELASSTTVSSEKFEGVNMTKLFVTDLSHREITFKTDDEEEEQVVFTKQEGIDVKEGTTQPEELFDKLKTQCRDNSNDALALSILLNRQIPNSMSLQVSNLERLGLTGGGNLVIGDGLEHGSYNVTNHGDGKYTISYSAKYETDGLEGYSTGNEDNPSQVINPEGQKLSLGLDFSYTVDLSEIGEEFTEVDLAELIEFTTNPKVSLEFVDDV